MQFFGLKYLSFSVKICIFTENKPFLTENGVVDSCELQLLSSD